MFKPNMLPQTGLGTIAVQADGTLVIAYNFRGRSSLLLCLLLLYLAHLINSVFAFIHLLFLLFLFSANFIFLAFVID